MLLMRPLSALDTSFDTCVLQCHPPKHDEEAADPHIAVTQPQHTGLHRLDTAAITTAAVNTAANKKEIKTNCVLLCAEPSDINRMAGSKCAAPKFVSQYDRRHQAVL